MTARRAAYQGTVSAGTVANAGALTSSAPAALTSAATAGGAPTAAEHDALRTDVSNLRTTVAALVVDVTALRTALNNALTTLRTAGRIS